MLFKHHNETNFLYMRRAVASLFRCGGRGGAFNRILLLLLLFFGLQIDGLFNWGLKSLEEGVISGS